MLCLFAVFAFSCNEEMERLLTDDYPESGTEYTTGHVLMVVIDGDRKSTRLNSSHIEESRMPSSA